MAATKKGIRVNELAKELGVESKAILTKLRDEGLGDAAPNHQSSIALGLAETVREWYATGALGGGGGGTATAVEAPPKVATKPKKPATGRRADGTDEDAGDDAAAPDAAGPVSE
ncbi:MAG: infB, partial [Phycisphaerales bacterium]|nr:infB [Phycisphaerales bacterium]